MKRVIFIFILSIFANLVVAQNSESFESRIEIFSSQNRTIQSDFVQTKKMKSIKNIVTSEGKFFYDNSGLMAMIYDEPKGDKIIINGEQFKFVMAGKVIDGASDDNPMMQQICNMLQASMTGDITKLGRGWQTTITENDTKYEVSLTPLDRRTKRYIESLVMVFRKSDMTLDELRMNDTLGGYTLYTFANKVINEVIDHQKFE